MSISVYIKVISYLLALILLFSVSSLVINLKTRSDQKKIKDDHKKFLVFVSKLLEVVGAAVEEKDNERSVTDVGELPDLPSGLVVTGGGASVDTFEDIMEL